MTPQVSSTQVAIVGAGPAGLVLGHLLHRAGIDAVVLEARSREHVERRVRAGVLEQTTVDVLVASGVGERLEREGFVHRGVELRYDGVGHRLDLSALTGGKTVTVYGQQEVVKDLVAAREAAGAALHFEVEDVTIDGVDGDAPVVRYVLDGVEHELRCAAIAGCDGFRGVCRPAVEHRMQVAARRYPFAWLGILADVAPSSDDLVYCRHDRGFALHSHRSRSITRLYLQVDADEDIGAWPDERIWDELELRFATDDGWELRRGPVIEKGITPLRSFVASPMRHGRLFLAGDAVHIVPPTGAKGLNLAVADVVVLAEALQRWLRRGDPTGLDTYSDRCLERVWRVQHFCWWMTSMFHVTPGQDAFDTELQRAQLRHVTTSPTGAAMLAENYVGLPLPA
jgi:p-hydroxybenzoate 3-monooxygenase